MSSLFVAKPHLVRLLTVTARLVQEQVATKLGPLGVSYAQAVVLVRLYRSAGGSLAQTDLIESLALSRASGTLVLSQLEARGLISRSHDLADARRWIISLTEASEAIEERVHECFDEVEDIVRRSLGPAEVDVAFSILARMLADVLKHRHTGT